jgi:hypothetical protein
MLKGEYHDDMAMITDEQDVIGGVDMHKHVHAAAALSGTCRLLGTTLFPTTRAGHRQLLAWLRGWSPLARASFSE